MRALAIFLVLGACGSSAHHNGAVDAGPDAGPICDYTEADDVGNATTAETSSVAVGAGTHNVCGTVNVGHYDAATSTVDVDRYRVTVETATADLLVRSFASPGLGTADFSVLIFTAAQPPTLVNGGQLDLSRGDHGVFRTSLVAGSYDIVVRARASADLAAPVDYRIRLVPDEPCAAITAPAAYVEAHDNADSRGNDMIAIDFSKSTPFTPVTNSAPEPTGLAIEPQMPVRISGTSANIAGTDQFMDRDTFQVTTTATTNELSVLLAWPPGPDLDLVVFQDQSTTETASSTTPGGDGSELATFAVKPSATYWLWVGGRQGSTGLPAGYDLSVCGAQVVE
jgi:hypothetical protein